MHFVYVLQSGKDGNLYIGCTGNVDLRLKQHEKGQVRATKGRRPLRLVYKEEYSDKYEAFRKERFYKTPKGKKELREKIHCGIV
ncbi:GIY-YIG nuclease family protein [Candidatus Kaiserbacteria bacterium]|nr:GIY-YIG nuclease family protein [Candidatus Kaiserbacteria bacterium]